MGVSKSPSGTDIADDDNANRLYNVDGYINNIHTTPDSNNINGTLMHRNGNGNGNNHDGFPLLRGGGANILTDGMFRRGSREMRGWMAHADDTALPPELRKKDNNNNNARHISNENYKTDAGGPVGSSHTNAVRRALTALPPQTGQRSAPRDYQYANNSGGRRYYNNGRYPGVVHLGAAKRPTLAPVEPTQRRVSGGAMAPTANTTTNTSSNTNSNSKASHASEGAGKASGGAAGVNLDGTVGRYRPLSPNPFMGLSAYSFATSPALSAIARSPRVHNAKSAHGSDYSLLDATQHRQQLAPLGSPPDVKHIGGEQPLQQPVHQQQHLQPLQQPVQQQQHLQPLQQQPLHHQHQQPAPMPAAAATTDPAVVPPARRSLVPLRRAGDDAVVDPTAAVSSRQTDSSGIPTYRHNLSPLPRDPNNTNTGSTDELHLSPHLRHVPAAVVVEADDGVRAGSAGHRDRKLPPPLSVQALQAHAADRPRNNNAAMAFPANEVIIRRLGIVNNNNNIPDRNNYRAVADKRPDVMPIVSSNDHAGPGNRSRVRRVYDSGTVSEDDAKRNNNNNARRRSIDPDVVNAQLRAGSSPAGGGHSPSPSLSPSYSATSNKKKTATDKIKGILHMVFPWYNNSTSNNRR